MDARTAYILGILTLLIPFLILWILSIFFTRPQQFYSTFFCNQRN